MDYRLLSAANLARSRREETPYGRVRVTPAMHQQLAEYVCEGTNVEPLGVIVTNWHGFKVEVDPDIPDPGWILETWRADCHTPTLDSARESGTVGLGTGGL